MTEQQHASGIVFSDDPARLDFEVVHSFLEGSYWSPGVPRETVEKAARGSLPVGLYEGRSQVGYARVITDKATFAYLADVFVVESHQGRGLGTWFMEQVLAHPDLQGLRRWLLTTQTAAALYERVGFMRAPFPERFLVIDKPNIYLQPNG